MAIPPGTTCRVLYAFKAEDVGELSVDADELVVVRDATSASADGWTLVERPSTAQRGFVPSDYLGLVALAAPSARPATDMYASAVATSSPSHGDGSLAAHAAREQAVADAYVSGSPGDHSRSLSLVASRGAGTAAATQPSLPVSTLPPEYAQLFASHEEWFRAASAKRAETYRGLQGEAVDLLRSLAESESRSKSLLSRVTELEGLINDERAKWSSGGTVGAAAHQISGLASGYAGGFADAATPQH